MLEMNWMQKVLDLDVQCCLARSLFLLWRLIDCPGAFIHKVNSAKKNDGSYLHVTLSHLPLLTYHYTYSPIVA